jgi:predicted DNA-binding transcriptional regulator YafY
MEPRGPILRKGEKMKRAREALRRLYWIDTVLQRETCPNAATLAEDLGVSRGTIHRDVARLRDEFKAPLIFDPSIGGFHYGHPYQPQFPDLPPEDLLALGAALQKRGPLTATALESSLRRLQERCAALLPGGGRSAAPSGGGGAPAPKPLATPRQRLGRRVRATRDRTVGPVTLLLRFDREVVADLLGERVLRRKDVQFLTDGGIEANVVAEDPDALLLDLLRWAPHFEIVSPAWIRRRLPMLLRRLLRNWEPKRRRKRV